MPTFHLPRRVVVVLATLSLLLFTTSALAQLQSGTLVGVITDNEGSALPGATVTVMGGLTPEVEVTDVEGRFRFLGLAPGRYEVKAELQGFSTQVDPNVPITMGHITTLEWAMTPAIEDVIDADK